MALKPIAFARPVNEQFLHHQLPVSPTPIQWQFCGCPTKAAIMPVGMR